MLALGSTHCQPAGKGPHVAEVVNELGGAVAGVVAQDCSDATPSSWKTKQKVVMQAHEVEADH